MNQKRLFVLTAFQGIAKCLSIRNFHQQKVKVYPEMFSIEFWNLADTIGIIVILAAIGFACWKLRGCFDSNSQGSNTVVIVSRGQAAPEASHSPSSPKNNRHIQPQVNNINLEEYRMKPTSQGNKSSQPVSAGNPYITSSSQYKNWSSGNDFGSAARQNESCSLCQQVSKEGERPRIVISCAGQHLFHVSCLNDHRSKILTFMGGNGLYKCPKCKEMYSANVYLYCNACRKTRINVNLSENSNKQGHLKLQELRNTYGDCCQNCRAV